MCKPLEQISPAHPYYFRWHELLKMYECIYPAVSHNPLFFPSFWAMVTFTNSWKG